MEWVILILVVAAIGYAIYIYNNLVRNRQLVEEGWSGIDVQLKRRADLIPNMLETVKGYMGHERETLQAVTDARAAVQAAQNASPGERGHAEGLLSGALGRLFAVAMQEPGYCVTPDGRARGAFSIVARVRVGLADPLEHELERDRP